MAKWENNKPALTAGLEQFGAQTHSWISNECNYEPLFTKNSPLISTLGITPEHGGAGLKTLYLAIDSAASVMNPGCRMPTRER